MDMADAGGDDRQARIVPELSVRRGRDAIAFYKAAFGAVEEYRVGGTDIQDPFGHHWEIGTPLSRWPRADARHAGS
jgi:uncharacterized glyoxalase superfamily protein PhnB